MTQDKILCRNCGSTAPKGSKFCPNCGSKLEKEDATNKSTLTNESPLNRRRPTTDERDIPFVDAVPVVIDEEVQGASAAATIPMSALTSSSAQEDCSGATYYINPTPAMLATSCKKDVLGGILFIESSGGMCHAGKFTVPEEVVFGHVLHGDKIDLSRADFVHPKTTLQGTAILGGLTIIVPRGVRVNVKGLGILGSFSGIKSQTVSAHEQSPLIVVRGVSILGEVCVKINHDVPPIRVVS